MSDAWVGGDTTPKSYTVLNPPYGLTAATSLVANLVKGATVHHPVVTVVDDTTLTVARTGLDLEAGVWSLEIEATFPDGIHTFPEKSPLRVSVRDDLDEG